MNTIADNQLIKMVRNPANISIIAGPCAIESYEQLEIVAHALSKISIVFFRGGAFKPRTSPYSFQGLGREGLEMLGLIKEKYQFRIVS